jgi:hypothetical protein
MSDYHLDGCGNIIIDGGELRLAEAMQIAGKEFPGAHPDSVIIGFCEESGGTQLVLIYRNR